MSLQAVAETIRHSNRILCVSHVNPDGDAVGSVLGIYWLLRALGKQAKAALQDMVPLELRWLPGASKIIPPNRVQPDYDLIICLDTSSPDRMGDVYQASHEAIPLLVIDHHATNTNFGTLNWVEGKSAATCEMLVSLVEELEIPWDKTLATCLLTGIVTDTLCFRTNNTTPAVMEAAVKLMQQGADLNEITQRTLDLRSFAALKLCGLALTDVKLEEGVVWVSMNRAQIRATAADPHGTNLNNIISRTVGADISAVFIEKDSDPLRPLVDCSFRAKPGFDVGSVALSFGGGGHRAAAGCTCIGTLNEVIETVIPRLKEARANK